MPTLEECCTLLTYHLRSLCRRLKANDETLTVFEPWTDRIRIQLPVDADHDHTGDDNNDDDNNNNNNSDEQKQQQQSQAAKKKSSKKSKNNKIQVIPFSSIYLEDSNVQKALRSCFVAFSNNNTSVTTVHLYALAQPELTMALSQLHGLHNLQHLRLSDPTRSHSLSCQVVTDMLQKMAENNNSNNSTSSSSSNIVIDCRLKSLITTTRLAMHSQEAIDALSVVLRRFATSSLQTVSLALLPRTNPQRPTLNLDSLVQAFTNSDSNGNVNNSSSCSSNLQSLHWTIGYQHNPYQQPLVKVETMQQFFASHASSSLHTVHLENLGLTDEHLIAMAEGAKANIKNNINNNLHTLICLHNPRITPRGLYAIYDLVSCHGRSSSSQLQTVQFLTRQHSSLLQWQCHAKDKTTATVLDPPSSNNNSSNSNNSKHVLSPLLLAHKAIQLAAKLNQMHLQEFLATTPTGNVGKWLDTVATTTTTTKTINNNKAATTNNSSQRSNNNDKNVALNDNDLALDLTFTLLRANPAMLLHYNCQEQAKCCTSPLSSTAAATTTSIMMEHHRPWLRRRSGKKASLVLDLAAFLLPAPPLFMKQQQQDRQDDSLPTTNSCSSSNQDANDQDDDEEDDDDDDMSSSSLSLSSTDSLFAAHMTTARRQQQSNNKKDNTSLSFFNHVRDQSPPMRRNHHHQQQQQQGSTSFSSPSSSSSTRNSPTTTTTTDNSDNDNEFNNVDRRREFQRQLFQRHRLLLLQQQQQQHLRRRRRLPPRRGGRRRSPSHGGGVMAGDAEQEEVHVVHVCSSLHDVSSALC